MKVFPLPPLQRPAPQAAASAAALLSVLPSIKFVSGTQLGS